MFSLGILGKHRKEDHDGNDYSVMCTILAHEDDISARKLLEASFILARSPKLNSRNEQLAISRDLLPFLDPCNL